MGRREEERKRESNLGACCGKRGWEGEGGGKKFLRFPRRRWIVIFLSVFLFLFSFFSFSFFYAFDLLRSSMAAMSDRLLVAYLSRIVEISFSF